MTRNVLHCGDNLEILATMEKKSVDLIYIAPPFFSNRKYEIIWGDEAEIRSFEDRWEGEGPPAASSNKNAPLQAPGLNAPCPPVLR